MATRYWEDYEVGEVRQVGSRTLTADEIKAFAREYDPQIFHLDEEAAKRTHFGGLVASGWQTACIAMRLAVDDFGSPSPSMGSPGMDEIRWLKPVRPGDTLNLRIVTLETRPSGSRTDRGYVKVRYEMTNQTGELVFTMTGTGIIKRKPT